MTRLNISLCQDVAKLRSQIESREAIKKLISDIKNKLFKYIDSRVTYKYKACVHNDWHTGDDILPSELIYKKYFNVDRFLQLNVLIEFEVGSGVRGRTACVGTVSKYRSEQLVVARVKNIIKLIYTLDDIQKNNTDLTTSLLLSIRQQIRFALVENEKLTIISADGEQHHVHVFGGRLFGGGSMFQSQADWALAESLIMVNQSISLMGKHLYQVLGFFDIALPANNYSP